MLRIASWNVNGIRACSKNGFLNWFQREKFDMVALQEVRADAHQIPPELIEAAGRHACWFAATSKKGYSGVGIVSLDPAEEILTGIGDAEFDVEGRTITMVTSKVILISAYFPNSQDKGKRVDYKIRFCKKIHKWAQELRTKYKRPLILCGDYNIAHEEIDLARPDSNHETAGFLPQEREWMGEFLDSGWVDSFRSLHPNEQRYSWWSARMKARERNVGWRIDYHCLPKEDASLILEADIQDQVMGSDHCPVTLKLKV